MNQTYNKINKCFKSAIALLEAIKLILQNTYDFFTKEGNVRLADNDTHDQVTINSTGVLLMPTNSMRRELTITNTSSKIVYIKKGAGITATNWSYRLSKGSVVIIDDYRGDVYGLVPTGTEEITVNETY
ncbi:MAG: hypothetical protein QNK20_16565 [Aureibaculum sp.]|nr:hypothetical protein [Aureibaculum sp.]